MNRAPHRPVPRPRIDGFTLIESLVALLVLSIGLLGVAAMQLSSLQSNNGAFQRTQATQRSPSSSAQRVGGSTSWSCRHQPMASGW